MGREGDEREQRETESERVRKRENKGRLRDTELGVRESRKQGAVLAGTHNESSAQATANAVQKTRSLTTPGRNSSARVGHV
jgi:hypothetical protein